ncbi:MAG: PIN domain-containing protein [Deltaproteobacteria bacterium]|nr:PIN domain-containing protein [Deltaproteobacteria bacterium]
MILLDTSAWIHFLNRDKITYEQLQRVVVCPPVVQEVLQGVKNPSEHERVKLGLLSFPCFGNPLRLSHFLDASEIYRVGRKKGYTIRSTVDCLIAAIAIESKVPVMHFDRDFSNIAKFTTLEVVGNFG